MTAEAVVVEPDELLAEIDDCIIICRRELSALKERVEFKERELERRKRSRPEFAFSTDLFLLKPSILASVKRRKRR